MGTCSFHQVIHILIARQMPIFRTDTTNILAWFTLRVIAAPQTTRRETSNTIPRPTNGIESAPLFTIAQIIIKAASAPELKSQKGT